MFEMDTLSSYMENDTTSKVSKDWAPWISYIKQENNSNRYMAIVV